MGASAIHFFLTTIEHPGVKGGHLVKEAPVLHRRFYGLDLAKDTGGFRITSSVGDVARKQAMTLRNRAARCRQLAATFYDQRIVCELETYACELEAQATLFESGNRSLPRSSVG
jgi:hypothetical protein